MTQANTLIPVFVMAALGCGAGSEAPLAQSPADTKITETGTAAGEADPVPRLRARGPAGLAEILASYDAMPAGTEKDALGLAVDRVAGQRYATTSRLYWYTELDEARAAAHASGKPILSLRMLGRLDEDLSCANSRFFRVALYANAEVSSYLADSFVLHWSSERAVPRATIDFGDGRVITTTVAGNSAHYVLDADGRPVDVLPGLYGPAAFIETLEPARILATTIQGAAEGERAAALAAFHSDQLAAAAATYGPMLRNLPAGSSIASAERVTMSKAMVEMPMVRSLALGAPTAEAASDLNLQANLALRAPRVQLDQRSRDLIRKLRPSDWTVVAAPLAPEALDTLIGAFESRIGAETVLNEAGFHSQIRTWFVQRAAPSNFTELNQRVYTELFRTPANDPWLGMATPGILTGLPGDGVTVQ
ncbi:MAG TPA: hypothetical protein VML75_17340 [Kofleriaceae bacterium]|nr:hypothetical protein [Kofleriaceae bacterium]